MSCTSLIRSHSFSELSQGPLSFHFHHLHPDEEGRKAIGGWSWVFPFSHLKGERWLECGRFPSCGELGPEKTLWFWGKVSLEGRPFLRRTETSGCISMVTFPFFLSEA